MNDDDIDQLVRHAAPASATPELHPLIVELREQIVTNARDTEIHRRGTSSRRVRRAIAIAATAAAATAAVVVVGPGDDGTTAYAAAVVAVAEGSPRLLIDEPGWEVTRADEFSADTGEMTFGDGEVRVDLHWRPAGTHDDYRADRAVDADGPFDITIAGDDGELFRYAGSDSWTAMWLRGDHSLELRIDDTDEAAFRAVASAVRAVDVDAWLDAMPASVVRPDDRSAVVDEMLEGLPLPASLDATHFEGTQTSDRYQLGALVAGVVACGWLDQWTEAERAGDEAAMDEAADAMASSTGWPILLEMDVEGDYSEVVWEYAAAVNGGAIDLPDGVESDRVRMDAQLEGYPAALGCDTRS